MVLPWLQDNYPTPPGRSSWPAGLGATGDAGGLVVFETRLSTACKLIERPVEINALAPLVNGMSGFPLVFDIETTGLNPGAGTLVILVGLGYQDRDSFVVRQYLLGEPAAEPAMLEAVARDLTDHPVLMTFNGKRFDLPLLQGRYHLHRLSPPLPAHHLDLLPLARRIWRRRLGRSNLLTLESRLLGVIRDPDVPGEEIPRRYLAFLHDRQREAIVPVIEHNRHDIVSLARLAGRIEGLLSGAADLRQVGPGDLLGLAGLLEQLGRVEQAVRYYEAALVGATPGERAEALFQLGMIARKQQELDRAIQLFEAVAQYSTRAAALGAIELAKIYEHRLRQPARALDYARRAIQIASLAPGSPASPQPREILQRIARLEARDRISRRAAPARTD